MSEILFANKNLTVIQLYKKKHRPGHPQANENGYLFEKKGKEYWVPLQRKIMVCRRSEKYWGFKHRCWGTELAEMRRSPGRDTHMKCTACGEIFPSRTKLVDLAKITYPDLGTVKFIAGLSRIYNG